MPLHRRLIKLERKIFIRLMGLVVLVFFGVGCVFKSDSGLSPTSTLSGSEQAKTPESLETRTPMGTTAPPTTSPPISTTDTPVATEDTTPFTPLVVSAPDCNYGGIFHSIEAIDRYTVLFTLCAPDPAFLSKIAFPTFGIQPQEWFEQTAGGGPGSQLLDNPVGTGPYRVQAWLKGERLVLTAFDKYWGGKQPGNQILAFRWDKDEVQRLLELQAGLVDGVNDISSADFPIVSEDQNLNLILRPAMNVFYIGINNSSTPFDDERVRQALAMGIDRRQIVEEYFPEGYELAEYFAPCAVPNACVGEPWYDYDLEMARQLLDDAGFPNGFQTKLIYQDVVRGYLPRPGLVANAIREQLRNNLGIDIRVEEMAPELYYENLDAGLLSGLHLLGWGADYPDITNFLNYHFGAQATGQFGAQNPEILGFLQQGASLIGDSARQPFYEAANNAIRQNVPMIPVAHGAWITPYELAVAYAVTVQGAHASPFGHELFSLISAPGKDTFTWLQGAEPLSLYCADETDRDSLRACAQVTETLYRYEAGGVNLQPALAKSCEATQDLTEWRCTLNESVLFHDYSTLDANDVVFSFWVQWDATHPYHIGNTGEFHYFRAFWGDFINQISP